MRTISVALMLLCPAYALAQSSTIVTTEAQLRTALQSLSAGDTVTLGANITLTGDLPSISTSMVFDGGGFTLSGNNQYRGLVVVAVSGGSPSFFEVTIQ